MNFYFRPHMNLCMEGTYRVSSPWFILGCFVAKFNSLALISEREVPPEAGIKDEHLLKNNNKNKFR